MFHKIVWSGALCNLVLEITKTWLDFLWWIRIYVQVLPARSKLAYYLPKHKEILEGNKFIKKIYFSPFSANFLLWAYVILVSSIRKYN
jgi:hypothetical protein